MNEHDTLRNLDPRFTAITDSLHDSLERLIGASPVTDGKVLPGTPKRGVYLFSEGGKPLYVGRSNHLRMRYAAHTLPSSGHNSAAFAMILARLETGHSRSVQHPRKTLMLDKDFSEAFRLQKQRIRQMNFQIVEEPRALQQTLLEIYCAVVLSTPYNDFENH